MGFKSARIKAFKKAADTANYMGVSLTTVSAWENGHRLPKADKLSKIADYYGCTVDELLEGNRKPEES